MDDINYKSPSSIALISKIIKLQNIDLIKKISEKRGLSNDIQKELEDEFIKLNYYCPKVILDSGKEQLQKYFVDKY